MQGVPADNHRQPAGRDKSLMRTRLRQPLEHVAVALVDEGHQVGHRVSVLYGQGREGEQPKVLDDLPC